MLQAIAQPDFFHGRNSDVDTSAEQLTTKSSPAIHGVLIKADKDNTGIVYVGMSGVTIATDDDTDGFPLEPSESVTIPVDNAEKVYVIADTNNQVVHWVNV